MKRITGISETLLISLYSRFLETQREDAIIKDEKSKDIVDKLALRIDDFGKYFWYTQVGTAVRTEIIDKATQSFLASNPDSVVVNLGCGLCTRFFRVDNQRVIWFDLDLPCIHDVWLNCFEETNRHKFLAYSILDFSWIDELNQIRDLPFLFIAEGLLPYFEKRDVRQFIHEIGRNFPKAEILIEGYSPIAMLFFTKHPAVVRSQASEVVKGGMDLWSVKTGRELEKWQNNIEFIEEWYFLDKHRNRWKWIQLFRYIPSFRKIMKVFRIRFSG